MISLLKADIGRDEVVEFESHRLRSLWDMLRFHAHKFVEVFNTLSLCESILVRPDMFFQGGSTLKLLRMQTDSLILQLRELDLPVSLRKAEMLRTAANSEPQDQNDALAAVIKHQCEDLRERIQHELEGRAIYYLSNKVGLLEGKSPPFGVDVADRFPSAIYDIDEAGKCLALRRSTASVMHLMRALEVGLACLAEPFKIPDLQANWHNCLDQIEKVINEISAGTHGATWREDRHYFSGCVSQFRIFKDAWRNHAMHVRKKYTEEEAEDIYTAVRSFMRHLSGRLSEKPSAARSS